jgi:hypothetical protein
VAARSKAWGQRPLAYWDCGFESRWGYVCLSLVSVVLSGRGLCDELVSRQRSPTECGVSKTVCDCEASNNEAAYAPKGLSSH